MKFISIVLFLKNYNYYHIYVCVFICWVRQSQLEKLKHIQCNKM